MMIVVEVANVAPIPLRRDRRGAAPGVQRQRAQPPAVDQIERHHEEELIRMGGGGGGSM